MLVCCWEKEKGEREKEKVLVLRTWGTHVLDAGPTKMHVFTILPLSDWFWVLKTAETCFQFWSLIHFTESLSDENRDSKLIQTSVVRWDPHDLDDENRKLSDITQNSLHPNKLLWIVKYLWVEYQPQNESWHHFACLTSLVAGAMMFTHVLIYPHGSCSWIQGFSQ